MTQKDEQLGSLLDSGDERIVDEDETDVDDKPSRAFDTLSGIIGEQPETRGNRTLPHYRVHVRGGDCLVINARYATLETLDQLRGSSTGLVGIRVEGAYADDATADYATDVLSALAKDVNRNCDAMSRSISTMKAMHAERARQAPDRVRFIDQTAIGLFVSGYPKAKIFEHAATLWDLRQAWLKAQG